jgi:hypothetical protein
MIEHAGRLRRVVMTIVGLLLLDGAGAQRLSPGADQPRSVTPQSIHLAARQIVCRPGDIDGNLRQIHVVEYLQPRMIHGPVAAQPPRTELHEPKRPDKVLVVGRSDDFDVNGRGDAPAWEKARWEPLQLRSTGSTILAAARPPYQTRIKMLYSATGLYVLMDATDQKLTATMTEDFLDLWKEDVFEFFLWPDEHYPVYFEYEISPLGFELPLLIPNLGEKFLGWRPWHYEGPRKTRKATAIAGGPRQSGAQIAGWKAEVFVPYELLKPLGNVPPKPGTRWRANFYRNDYDDGRAASWDWARVGSSYHEFRKFGTLVFD